MTNYLIALITKKIFNAYERLIYPTPNELNFYEPFLTNLCDKICGTRPQGLSSPKE